MWFDPAATAPWTQQSSSSKNAPGNLKLPGAFFDELDQYSLLASWVLVIRKRLRSEALVESCVGNDDFMRSYSQREIWHILHDREAGIENCRVREACIALLPNVCGRAKFYALIAEI